MAPSDKKNFSKHKDAPKTPVTTDPRFAKVHNDPRFLRPKKKDLKVTIDKRFASMMNSTDFSDAPSVDKYGRRIKKQSAKKELERFYQLEDEDDEGSKEKSVEELEKELAADAENLRDEVSESDEEEEEEESESDEEETEGYDPMRGRGVISDSDSDESDTDESDTDKEDHVETAEDDLDEVDKIKTIYDGEETSRLALVNMDWDKIKAVDILKVINGFKPDTGVVKSVTIYPSEFGKERMAQEDAQGPPAEIFRTKTVKNKKESNSDGDNHSDDDDEEITAESMIKNQLEEGDGQDFDQEALRKYQLDRLKYYYAVIECDSPQTAKTIYKLCDGTEYENSANFFDLRYIPEDMTFDDEPKDVATVAPEGYQPTKFKTDALQQTKVSLTWDEDDVNRYQLTRREFTQEDLKELDFDAYLASTDEEDEGEDLDALREKYRKLVSSEKKTSAFEDSREDEEEEGDMEITFTPGLSEAAAAVVHGLKEEEDDKEDETTIEKYIRKQKEKRQAKKEKAKQQQKAENSDSEANDEEASDIDEETKNDPYFKEALQEMEKEGFATTESNADKKKKKRSRKRASKEEREQKAKERAELELLMGDQAKSDGFDMKEVLKAEKLEKKKKGKKGKKADESVVTDNFEIDVSDPRFAAIKESHHFAIDPTNPHFKKTKNMQKLINARQTKMKEDHEMTDVWKKDKKSTDTANAAGVGSSADAAPKSSSLQQLVASVKRKGALDQQSSTGKRQKK